MAHEFQKTFLKIENPFATRLSLLPVHRFFWKTLKDRTPSIAIVFDVNDTAVIFTNQLIKKARSPVVRPVNLCSPCTANQSANLDLIHPFFQYRIISHE
ncbi:MAG: hypothetical protein BLM47_11675 [Candidatus Reconcilbacillus cellulovorans]|uniref:Uncharacterized protein n=1 Tax=Candidatus Reconcilbacillus cellulovorans TaxID=1906605 RepID=A0A2A6DXS6_9BACL|nr:MAG: hypothetical protein BLM47_11675 [Candidatus Reconcilbacillus cellulovorans]